MKLTNIYKQMMEATLKKERNPYPDYTEFGIYDHTTKIGYISVDYSGTMLKIDSIFIEPKFRGTGISSEMLKNCVNTIKKKKHFDYIEWYAVSQQSGKAAIKAFGQPIKIDTPFKEYDSFNDAVDGFGLQTTASTDSDGTIIAGEDDAIRLVFKV